MSRLCVSLFGKFKVQRDEIDLPHLDARKLQELFSYLLLYRQTSHPRELLAALLWSEYPTPQSKKYLRQTLWQLQTALDAHTARILIVEPDWIQINPAVEIHLDVALLENVYQSMQGIAGQNLSAEQANLLRIGVAAYSGNLLEGWYHDWCLYERERLQNMFVAMLDKLMDYCEKQGDYESGLGYGMRILRYECARERTHKQMMRLYYLAGDRTAALRQYERCVTVLRDELGVQPSEKTQDLYRHICADHLEDVPEQTAPHSVSTPSISSMLTDLQRMHTSLADMQRQIQSQIQALALAVNDDI